MLRFIDIELAAWQRKLVLTPWKNTPWKKRFTALAGLVSTNGVDPHLRAPDRLSLRQKSQSLEPCARRHGHGHDI
jgi:hypothetical protein